MQTLHSMGALYGTVLPQRAVVPDPGGHFGQLTQVILSSGNFTVIWASWQTRAAIA